MKPRAFAAVLLVLGLGALPIGLAGRRDAPAPRTPVPERPSPEVEAIPPPAPPVSVVPTPAEADPLVLFRGNAACDRIAGLEHGYRMYRRALGFPSDEWIRLVHIIGLSAGELWEATPPTVSDAELAFTPGGFEAIRGAAHDLARLAQDYYTAARTRQASSVATLRPTFEESCEAFMSLVRRSLRP